MALFNLPKELAKSEIRKHLPIGPGWFSEQAVKSGELSKLVDVFSTNIGLWLSEVKSLRKGLYLNLAESTDLDQWGLDLGVERLIGELDDLFRARLRTELLRLRVTRPAIKTYIEDLTGLKTTVITPWQFQDWRARRTVGLADGAVDPFYGRSGQARRTSEYWQSGVIDIVTDGYSSATAKNAYEVVAAGVRAYYTSSLSSDVLTQTYLSSTPTTSEMAVIHEGLVSPVSLIYIYSGTNPRSGHIFSTEDAIVSYGLLADQEFVVGALEGAEIYQYDLWPPVRSVFTLGRSPMSGAYGEHSNFLDDPAVFGGVLLSAASNTHSEDTQIVNDYIVPLSYGSILSSNKGRSGYDARLDEILAQIEYLPEGLTVLWDRPDLDGPYTVYDVPLSWECMENYTWDQAIDIGHSGQPAADVVISA